MGPLTEILSKVKTQQHAQNIGGLCVAISTFNPEKAKVVSLEFDLVCAVSTTQDEAESINEAVMGAIEGLRAKIAEINPNIHVIIDGTGTAVVAMFESDEQRQEFVENHAEKIALTKEMLEK